MEAAGGLEEATDDIYEAVLHILTEPIVELVVQEEDVKESVTKNEPLMASCNFEAREILTPASPDLSLQTQFSFPPIRIPTKPKLQPRVLLHRLSGEHSFNKMNNFKKKVNLEDFFDYDICESEIRWPPKRGRGRPRKSDTPIRIYQRQHYQRKRDLRLEKNQERNKSKSQNDAIMINVKKEDAIAFVDTSFKNDTNAIATNDQEAEIDPLAVKKEPQFL